MNLLDMYLGSFNQAVSPDRRGRAALKFYRFLKIIGFLKVYWKPLRQVNRNVGLQGNNE
jgi:hypothetical protein